MNSDQRKAARYIPKRKSFASLESSLVLVGRITDIGLGGMAMEYITDEKSSASPKHVDIFTSDEQYMLSSIPCTLVYQTSKNLPGSSQLFTGQYMNIRCGLKFEDLDKDQTEKITDFLENQTTGIVAGYK